VCLNPFYFIKILNASLVKVDSLSVSTCCRRPWVENIKWQHTSMDQAELFPVNDQCMVITITVVDCY